MAHWRGLCTQSVLDLRVIKRQCKKIADSELQIEGTDLQRRQSAEVQFWTSPAAECMAACHTAWTRMSLVSATCISFVTQARVILFARGLERWLAVLNTKLLHYTVQVEHHRIRNKPYSPVIRGPRCKECHLCSTAFGAKYQVSAPVYHGELDICHC